jgi:hypothetical protein
MAPSPTPTASKTFNNHRVPGSSPPTNANGERLFLNFDNPPLWTGYATEAQMRSVMPKGSPLDPVVAFTIPDAEVDGTLRGLLPVNPAPPAGTPTYPDDRRVGQFNPNPHSPSERDTLQSTTLDFDPALNASAPPFKLMDILPAGTTMPAGLPDWDALKSTRVPIGDIMTAKLWLSSAPVGVLSNHGAYDGRTYRLTVSKFTGTIEEAVNALNWAAYKMLGTALAEWQPVPLMCAFARDHTGPLKPFQRWWHQHLYFSWQQPALPVGTGPTATTRPADYMTTPDEWLVP